MNRLSIILALAFVSYSLGAPENISESQIDQNHGLENGSDQILPKQDGFEDLPTPDPSEILTFTRYHRPRTGISGTSNSHQPKDPKNPNGGTRDGLMCPGICKVDCGSGFETGACLKCMSKCMSKTK